MKTGSRVLTIAFLVASYLPIAMAADATEAEQNDGAALFEERCANCHDNPAIKAPTREALSQMSKAAVLQAMEFGRMQPQAAGLSKQQKLAIAGVLAAANPPDMTWLTNAKCDVGDIASDARVAGWGYDSSNARFQAKERSGITTDNVGRLELAWAFAYSGVTEARSQPVLTSDTIFTGTKSGLVLALDRLSGCVKWHFQADVSVRSGLVFGSGSGEADGTIYFSDALAQVHALRASDGKLLWKTDVALFPTSVVTGTPTLHEGRLYVPLSSYEAAMAGLPAYPCCRSHGAVVSIDVDGGAIVWTTHTAPHAEKRGQRASGVDKWGPSGVSVWSTPAIDAKRGLLYVGTGGNASHPATEWSDAVLALDLASGEVRWSFQGLKGDVWNSSCLFKGPNCPENAGPDYDFGASVIVATLADGRDVLFAGQKSGEVFALDPDATSADARVMWRNKVGRGSSNGGVHWGMSFDGAGLYVPMADPVRKDQTEPPRPGMYALNPANGQLLWADRIERGCAFDAADMPLAGLAETRAGDKARRNPWPDCSFYYGLSSAATSVPGLVFAGGLDGKLRAYDAGNGDIVWSFDTKRAFQSKNGVEAHGGAIDVQGPVIADGMLFIQSGYGLFGQMPGNVLLAFRIPDPTLSR